MHILMLGAATSVHCVKIANGLIHLGHKVSLVGLASHRGNEDQFDKRVQLYWLSKSYYFSQGKELAELFHKIGADILYAHYATGYGYILRDSGIHPSVLAVWGSDIYDFPHTSLLHRWMLKRNLAFPDAVFSTSHVMARAAQQILDRPMRITPFGVDMKHFVPRSCLEIEEIFPQETMDKLPAVDSKLHIGFIKGLTEKYGLSYLLEAFQKVLQAQAVKEQALDLVLDIYGTGKQEAELKALAHRLGIANRAIFHGRIINTAVPEALRRMQLFCLPSTLDSESFGVSAVEAMACGVPLIVSDVDGFREVTENGRYACMIPRCNAKAMERAILDYLSHPEEAKALAKEARAHVNRLYDWNKNAKEIAEGLEAVWNGKPWARSEDEFGASSYSDILGH